MSERELFELWLAEYDGKSNIRSFRDSLIVKILSRHIPSFDLSMIERNEHGKPLITRFPLSFSLSHCGRNFALVVSSCDHCGVDIQKVEDRDKFDEAYRSVFTDREYEILSRTGDDREFSRLWSIKEAFIKARGGSIWYGRDHDLYGNGETGRDQWTGKEGLELRSIFLPSGKWLSLALPVKPERFEIKKIT